MGVPKEVLVDSQLFAVRTIDLTNDRERLYQRFYFNMNRGKFDRWLFPSFRKTLTKIRGDV